MNSSEKTFAYCGSPVHPDNPICNQCGKPQRTEPTLRWSAPQDQTVLGRPQIPAQPPIPKPEPNRAAPQVHRTVRQPLPSAMIPPLQKNKTLLGVGLGGLLIICLCVCIGVGGGGVLLLSGSLPVAVPTDTPPFLSETSKVLESLAVVPGETIRDSRGAALSVPSIAQPEGYQASFVVSAPAKQLGEELSRHFGKEIRLYSLETGEINGVGRMQLALPASSADMRLGMLVDGSDLIILPNPPQNGWLTVSMRAGGGVGNGQSTQYLVLKPNPKTLETEPGAGRQAALASATEKNEPTQATITGVNCSSSWSWNDCRRDSNSIVFVTYKKKDASATMTNIDARIDDLIARILDIYSKYYDGGKKFTYANVSSSYPVTVKISSSYKNPEYIPSTGNIYLNWNIVNYINNLNSSDYCAVAHEIMHWIQDEQYPMNINYYSNIESWWLEMTAMYGFFLYASDCINKAVETYGHQTISNNQRAYQAEPYKWSKDEEARYIQSIQFYLGVCTGTGCALSEADLITAINAGSYPYNSTRQIAYRQLAKDTGLYMLGEPPTTGNTKAPILPAYQAVGAYFDTIEHSGDPSTPFIFPNKTGNQFKQVSPLKASVSAQIAHGAEYPLYIDNDKKSKSTGKSGLPGMVRISPGTAVWTKLDGQKAVFQDGKAETILAPIGKMSSPSVGILAVAPNGPATLNLTYEVADLSGDWGATHSNFVKAKDECKEPVDIEKVSEQLNSDLFLTYFSGFGTFILDSAKPDGSRYIWQGSFPYPGVTGKSEILVEGEKIVLNYELHFPTPKSQSMPQFGLMLFVTGGLIGMKGKRRVRLLLVGLILLPLILSGCSGMTIYGDVTGVYTFTKMTYIDPKINPGNPFPWTLTGKGLIDIALELTFSDQKTYPPPCHKVFQTDVTAKIGKDGSIIFKTN